MNNKINLDKNELILCKCGCGNLRKKYDKKGRECMFIFGHQNRGIFNPSKQSWVKEILRNSHLGKKKSKETNEKMREIMKGRKPWSTGLTKENNNSLRRQAMKMTGRKLTEQHKNKISDGVKKNLPSTNFKNVDFRSKIVVPAKDSSIEVKIQNFLKELGIQFFTHQYMKEIEHGYQCDILIPSMNLVIECDGDYWHKYPIGKKMDYIHTKELIEKGFKVLRLWEHEIRIMNIENFTNKLNNIN